MAFQKFRAGQLFDGTTMLGHENVLITSATGIIEAIVPVQDAGDDVQQFEGIITPGFVNCHCHLELSHMKGHIPEKTGLVDFVSRVITERHGTEEEILLAIDEAENEMIRGGIVAVGDICNNTLTIVQKSKRNLTYHNFIEASGFLPQVAQARWERAQLIFDDFAGIYSDPFLHNSIVPHAPYSVSKELWQRIRNFPGNPISTIHNQEAIDENALFLNGSGRFPDFYRRFNMDDSFFIAPGKTSFQTFIGNFLPAQTLIAVHNVHTAAEDLACYQSMETRPELCWCLCPNANLYIGGQLPDVRLLMNSGLLMVLGTDSLASNGSLSLISEMRTLLVSFPFLDAEILLRWATINGAKALHLDQLLGSFEPGKQPGIVLCDATLSSARRLL
jgi:cytosine/adenosine deaminase-related metal-dependent hydrolase